MKRTVRLAAAVFLCARLARAGDVAAPIPEGPAPAVSNIFAAAPAPWTAAVAPLISGARDAPSLTPVVMGLEAKGYTAAVTADGRAVLLKDGREAGAGAVDDVRRAQHDAYDAVDRVAADLVKRASSPDMPSDRLVDLVARLTLLDRSLGAYIGRRAGRGDVRIALHGLRQRLDERQREALALRMTRIAAALGSTPLVEDPGSAVAAGAERAHASGLLPAAAGREAARDPASSLIEVPWPGELQPRDPWKQFDEEYQRKSAESMNASAAVYLNALAQGDYYAKFLQAAGAKFGPRIELPPLSAILAYYDKEVDRLVREGVVRPDEVLRPVRVYHKPGGRFFKKEGSKIGVRVGEKPPEGASPSEGIMDDGDFGAMLAQGMFPVGEPGDRDIVGLQHSAADHDLAHLSTFLQTPRYMAAVRRLSERLGGKEPADKRQARRAFVFNELLSAVPPENRDALLALVPEELSKRAPGLAHVSEVSRALAALDGRTVEKLRRDLYDAHPRLVRRYGGAMADIAVREHTTTRFEPLLDELRAALAPRARPLPRGELDLEVSRYLVAAFQSTRVGVDDWMEAAASKRYAKDSPVRRYVCGTGVWSADSYLYDKYCSKKTSRR